MRIRKIRVVNKPDRQGMNNKLDEPLHGKGSFPKTDIDCAHEPERVGDGWSNAQHGRCELWCLCARWKDWLWCAACKLFGEAREGFPVGKLCFLLFARQARCFFSQLAVRKNRPTRRDEVFLSSIPARSKTLPEFEALAAVPVHGKRQCEGGGCHHGNPAQVIGCGCRQAWPRTERS